MILGLERMSLAHISFMQTLMKKTYKFGKRNGEMTRVARALVLHSVDLVCSVFPSISLLSPFVYHWSHDAS